MADRAAALLSLAAVFDDLRSRAKTPSAVADLARLAATSRRLARRHMH